MSTYHVNPKTGNVGVCSAYSPANCPFGASSEGVATHYESKASALAGAEVLFSKQYGGSLGQAIRDIPSEKVKEAIAAFEEKSPYSSSMTKTYQGGLRTFVQTISKNHNGGIHERSGPRPVKTFVGDVLFRKETASSIEFDLGGKLYRIDKRETSGGWTAYSDPYPAK